MRAGLGLAIALLALPASAKPKPKPQKRPPRSLPVPSPNAVVIVCSRGSIVSLGDLRLRASDCVVRDVWGSSFRTDSLTLFSKGEKP